MKRRAIRREDFIWTVGHMNSAAIINRRNRIRYGHLSTMELAEAGLYSTAFRSALFSSDSTEQSNLLRWFTEHTSLVAENFDDLKRLFGVFDVPQGTVELHVL